jgi:hypothetical protein
VFCGTDITPTCAAARCAPRAGGALVGGGDARVRAGWPGLPIAIGSPGLPIVSLSISLSLYIYIHIHIYIYMYMKNLMRTWLSSSIFL